MHDGKKSKMPSNHEISVNYVPFGLETRDTADLEVCATLNRYVCGGEGEERDGGGQDARYDAAGPADIETRS
jgi:hypothetical protein